ncbi:MAG: 16S rRNA (cytosine(967)-C(5))-methyltransferase RsmB [Clostridia bacterium]|nr:16S rRNA (cytosine(967)-C(5))-methyltransferase RsmB [Clostridia bacterium]
MKSPRQSAFDILLKIHKDSAYSNIALDAELDSQPLSGVDRAFVSALVYGTLERAITLDYQIEQYLTQPVSKLKAQVLTALRMGAYQLLFMDKIPSSAAVNESVKLVKTNSCSFAAGLVNAVLRKVSANGIVLPEKKGLYYYSIKYSCPKWLIKLWKDAYGEENAVKIAKASLGGAETVLRVNTLRTTADELTASLNSEGVNCRKAEFDENALVLEKAGSLKKLRAYDDGLFHVQDTASQLCCKALGAKAGDTVLDICSAPGGKAFTTAQYMKNEGRIVACDIYEGRLNLIKNGAQRLGISIIETAENDGSVHNSDFPMADKILCDVPCAGLGVIRRKPEIRFKDGAEVDKLPEIQYSILKASAGYLKKGGVLVYSTCSLNPAENEEIITRFLNENSDFESLKVLPEITRYGEDTDYLTLMPHIHSSDGFFVSAIRRRIDS